MKKYGFVYIWRDRKHKRYYIGSRWGHVDDGYICSSNWMKRAYLRRPQDFKRRIIATNVSREDLRHVEQAWINLIKPEEIRERYYNLCRVVQNLWHYHSDLRLSIGEKISVRKKGKSNGPHSEATKQLMSERKKGSKFTEEHREKLRAAKLGKKQSAEANKKRSETMKLRIAQGHVPYKVSHAGHTHSEESRIKMSITKRNR